MLETMTSDPIVEAIFEIRFTANTEAAAAILIGQLHHSLRPEYPKSERLPINDIPLEVRNKNESLHFAPEMRISGHCKSIHVGRNCLGVTVSSPYPGWVSYKKSIMRVLELAFEAEVIEVVNRAAFRYINVISAIEKDESDYDVIEFDGNIGGYNLKEVDTGLKFTTKKDDISHTVQVKNNSIAKFIDAKEKVSGLLLDIDTSLSKDMPEFWGSSSEILDSVRSAERRMFEQIVKSTTLDRYKK